MNAKTELFLYQLLWSADRLARPTFRNLSESFEGWAYRSGFWRQIARLERQAFLERNSKRSDERLYRLTKRGRLHALGGRDPVDRWARHWDGLWRLVVFDVPVVRNRERAKLRRYLKGKNFGCLQDSVWISPDPLREERKAIGSAKPNVESLIFFEAKTSAGESVQEVVAAAWDFGRVNAAYRRCLQILESRPKPGRKKLDAKEVMAWIRLDWAAWREVVAVDPLLPRALLPEGYLGEEAWKRRRQATADVSRFLQDIKV